MIKRCFLFFLFGISAAFQVLLAQSFTCSGKVLDEETRLPLAFVNIVTDQSKIGTATDIDGKFEISSQEPIEFLRLSYVGYEPTTFYLHGKNENLKILLKKTTLELDEVVIIAGENPAHRIIQHVIDNRDANDPEKLQSFSYTSYDKMVFTVDTLQIPDIPELIADSIYSADTARVANEVDSSDIRLKKYLENKDFFLLETVSERKFLYPDRNHQKVLASRISGFKDPVFLFLSSQMQSSSFYKEMITISDKNYINPISDGSLKKYFFQIEDTTYTTTNDTVFIISFRPGINTNFDGLKGVMSINTNGWAIQNVIAEPSRDEGGVSIKIQQMYEFIEGTHWFPVQLNTDIILKHVAINKYPPVGRGKNYIRNIVLNPELVKRQFNQISIEVDPNAGDRSEDYWIKYRGDSLTERERNVYEFMDSVGKVYEFDKKVKTFKSLITGRLPMGKIDLDLSKIVKYNAHEGLYLGLGLLTSPKLSETFSLGGFWGYGFKDQTAKYGGDLGITIDKYREIKLRLSYFDYVTETGGTGFFDDRSNMLNPDNFRDFLIERMDRTERKQASISFRALRYATLNFGLTADNKRPTYNYNFAPPPSSGEIPLPDSNFNFTEISAGFRFAYKEKFIQLPDTKISTGTKYPVFWFNYSRGIAGFLDGEYDYNKFDLKIQKSFFIKYFGKSAFDIRAGYIDKPVPYTNLYNGRGAYRTFTIYAPASFATERMNEFLADRYVYLFYSHNFGKLLWRGKKFSPEFVVSSNAGFGWLDHPEYHSQVAFDVMDKGYFESGLLINNIFNMMKLYTLGVGVYYRYGAYSLPEIGDNFAYKFTLVFPF